MPVMDLFSLGGKVAVVTGAGRGLGEAMARALSEAGASVIVADIKADLARGVAASLQEGGREAMALPLDVRSYEEVEDRHRSVVDRFGRVDILVNNAGVVYTPRSPGGSASIPLEQVDPQTWRSVIEVNLIGVFNCTHVFGRTMLGRQSGSIINIASISAFVANLGRSNNAYCASKGAVVAFTRELATEWAPKNIRVNAIAPGYMRTSIGAPLDDPQLKDLIPRMTPMVRPGYPADLAGTVVYLASEASGYVTGQTIVVDGGYTAW